MYIWLLFCGKSGSYRMCLNPHLLLCKKIIYKGFEKTILLWNTSFDDYCRGSKTLCYSDDVSYKLGVQLAKYGLTLPVTFDTRIEIPCRTCLECTRKRALDWSVRCELEAQQYSNNYFVTLTYNDDNLPFNFYKVYDKDNECYITKRVSTLVPSHTVSFMKLLRQYFKRKFNHTGIRFFLCGEYGTVTSRPHYHLILFNLPLNDLVLNSHSKNGFPLFRSSILEKIWKKGFVTVQPYSIETARYVAQYCCKKMNKAQSSSFCRQMEFINMSRNPGIGSLWFFKNVDNKLIVRDSLVCDKLYFSSVKDNEPVSSVYSMPSAFYRYFKPVTNSCLGLDTDTPPLYCLKNSDGDLCFDVLVFKRYMSSLFYEKRLRCSMSELGFDYDKDRYSPKYLEYLELLRRSASEKFKIQRNSC